MLDPVAVAQAVEEAQKRPEITDIAEAIRMQALYREELEAIAALKAELEKRHDWVRTVVVPKLMEDADVTTITIEGVGRVHLQDDVYVSTPAENRERAMRWFDDNGFGDLISNTINGSTLAAWVRRRLKSGQEIPDLIKVTPYTKAVLTRV